METYIFNESFILASGIRISVYRKQHSFIYNILLVETIISSNVCSRQPKRRISLKNTFPLDGKKTSRGLRKMEKKDGFHQPENHLSKSKNKLFLSKLFSLYSSNGFYQQRKSTDQKILFPLGRKSVCTSRVKDINKYVSSSQKIYFYFKKSLKILKKIGTHQKEYGLSLIDFPLISLIVSTYRKKLGIKQLTKKQIKTSFSRFQYVLVKQKTASTGRS